MSATSSASLASEDHVSVLRYLDRLCAVFAAIAAVGALSAARPRPTAPAVPVVSVRQLLGRWQNAITGIQFEDDGGVLAYLDGGVHVYRSGAYAIQPPNRVRILFGATTRTWIVHRVTPTELEVVDPGHGRQVLRRVPLDAVLLRSAAARCEVNMRVILTAEEQYEIDHAVYKPIGPKDSFVAAGMFAKEPRCPSGGRYTVVVGPNGELTVHCSVKAHDFGGRGLR